MNQHKNFIASVLLKFTFECVIFNILIVLSVECYIQISTFFYNIAVISLHVIKLIE